MSNFWERKIHFCHSFSERVNPLALLTNAMKGDSSKSYKIIHN